MAKCRVVKNVGGGKKTMYLGIGKSFNIKELLPNDYLKLSIDNFVCEPEKVLRQKQK